MELLMRRRHLGAVAFLVALTLAACSRDVDEPTFDSPFDPDSPSVGEGYELQASVAGDNVLLSWRNVTGRVGFPPGDSLLTSSYRVDHGIDGLDPTTRATGLTYTTAPSLGQPLLAQHRDYVPETVNTYRVQGLGVVGDDGESVSLVPSTIVSVDAPLEVIPSNGTNEAPSLTVDFDVRSGVSTAVEFALDEGITESVQSFDLEPGVRRTVSFAIRPFDSASGTQTVFYRSSRGEVGSIELEVGFDPGFEPFSGVRIAGTRNVAVDDTVLYRVGGEGVVAAFVRTRELVVQPGDAPPDTIVTDLLTIADLDAPFRLPLDAPSARDNETTSWTFSLDAVSELGFATRRSLFLDEAGPITEPGLTVVDDDGVVSEREITLQLAAGDAGEFLLSENADFTGAVWRDFTEEVAFTLSEGAGEKTLFVAYRNDFVDEIGVASTSVLYLPPPDAR